MSLVKPVTLTPAKLAANRAKASPATGPGDRQTAFRARRRELLLLASVARVCEWWDAGLRWYAEEADYAVYGGERTHNVL